MKKSTLCSMLIGGTALAAALAPRSQASEQSVLMKRIVPMPYEVVLELPEAEETNGPYVYQGIPIDVQEAAWKYGDMYGISPELLMAMAFYESSYNPAAIGGECLGLMQVNPRWHRDRMARLGVSEDGLLTADGSMAVGADYLSELMSGTENEAYALMKYNGDSRAESYLRCECRMSGYAERILRMKADLITEAGNAEE